VPRPSQETQKWDGRHKRRVFWLKKKMAGCWTATTPEFSAERSTHHTQSRKNKSARPETKLCYKGRSVTCHQRSRYQMQGGQTVAKGGPNCFKEQSATL